MPYNPDKGYEALRRGRVSGAGFTYFITFCTAGRLPGLNSERISQHLVKETRSMQAESIWTIRCATLMPDHVHLLIDLGDKLSLGKAVARLKARTASTLRESRLAWQAGYYDHRLRQNENILPYFLYVYLNPHRAGLIPADAEWPWFICETSDRIWFMPMINQGLPEPEWLANLP
jgi:putative transposase